jgi:uncharacterized protein (TIGR02145 family)
MQTKNKKYAGHFIVLVSFLLLFSISCKKDDNALAIETGTVTDTDGNIYKTVKIGSTWWMPENLKTKRYNTGDSIALIPGNIPDSAWSKSETGAYCYFDEKYGFLYNYYAIADPRGLAPAGWHIPTDNEWKDLEMFLGMSGQDAENVNWRGGDQGNKLKIVGGNAMFWYTASDVYSIFGTNESGFTALGGSCRLFNGQWGELTHTGFWWSSSSSGNEAWYRGLDYNKTSVFRYFGPKTYGFSVRCVKD